METVHPDILPRSFRHEVHKTATDVRLWAGLTGKRLPRRDGRAFAQHTAAARYVPPNAFLTGLVLEIAAILAARTAWVTDHGQRERGSYAQQYPECHQ